MPVIAVVNRPRLAAALALLAVGFAVSLASTARADVEPNDNFIAAEGPLAPQTYTGELSTEQDVDWYWVQLAGQQQIAIHVAQTNAGECGSDVSFSFDDYFGQRIERIEYNEPGEADSEVREGSFLYTTPPGGGTFYLEVSGETSSAGCAYSFSIGPGSAYAPPPAKLPITAVPEPNDLESQAFGPLAAGTLYSGTIEADSDVDMLYLIGRGGQTVDFQLTAYGCDDGGVVASFFPEEAHPYETRQGAYPNTRATRELDVGPSSKRYDVKLTGDSGCRWFAEVSPAASLLASLPGERPPNRCAIAKRGLRHRRAALKRARRKLRRARTRRARGRLHHQVEARRRAVRLARHRVKVRC